MSDQTVLSGDAMSSAHAEGGASTIAASSVVLSGDAISASIANGGQISEASTHIRSTSAVSGAVAYGGYVRRAGEVITDLSAKVYARDDMRTSIVELSRAKARTFLDQLNDTGSGGFELQANDADRALIPDDSVIRFDVKGFAAWSMLVDDEDTQTLAVGEEVDQITKLTGFGHLTVLDEAVVYPARGTDTNPFGDDRAFNWTSPDFRDIGWHNAVPSEFVYQAMTDWPLLPFAAGFPVFSYAQMIWDRRRANNVAPPGDGYFRRTYTSTGGALIFVILDDGGEVYFDGQHVISCQKGFSTVYTEFIQCSPGPHTISIYCSNGPGAPPPVTPFDNPTGVGAAVWPCDMNGQPTSAYPDVVTDDTWRIITYPPRVPGMTPGEVIRHCIGEAQARGCFPEITLTFNDEVDTEGVAWPNVTDIVTKVGTNLLTFLRELSATYVDVWMSPASFALNAYVRDGRGGHRAATLAPGVNLVSLQHKRKRRVSTSILTRYAGGWHERTSPAGITARGRHEIMLGLGAAASISEVERVDDRQLDVFGHNRVAISAVLQPVAANGSDQPYRGFRVGDTIAVPGVDGDASQERVIALTVKEDEHGTLSYVPELKDLLLSADERFAETVLKMSNGTAGGQSIVATPAAMVGTATPDCCPPVPPHPVCT
jgi:hypothetical protein